MASVSTDFKRLFLRNAKWDSETGAISLYAQLKSVAQGKYTTAAGGMALSGTSQAGHSVTLTLPASGRGLSPHEIAELAGEMLDRWEEAVAYLEITPVDYESDEDDAAIFTEMLSRLKAVRSIGADFSAARLDPEGVTQ